MNKIIEKVRLIKFYLISGYRLVNFHEHSIFYHLQIFKNYKKYFSTKGSHFFVACFPKSGSTFISNVITEISLFQKVGLVHAYGRREQEIDYIKLWSIYDKNTVCQQHTRATQDNIEMLKEFDIKPIILVRNIFDVVISIREHLYSESLEKPMAYFEDSFYDLDESTQYDMIIELMIPWYFNFYVSWYIAKSQNSIQTCWVTYENFLENPTKCLQDIFKFQGWSVDNASILQGLEKAQKTFTRFNKGVIGRGKIHLSEKQQNKIKTFTRFYPTINFSPIGI